MNILCVEKYFFPQFFFKLTFRSQPSKDRIEEGVINKIVVIHLVLSVLTHDTGVEVFSGWGCISFFIVIKIIRKQSYLTFVCWKLSDY